MNISANIIKLTDTAELLDFELENREWFEQHIPPRPESFYSLAGVQTQIEEFLDNHQNELMLPMLLRTNEDQICGRLNLTIDPSEPMVGMIGYRVGKLFTRQGVATKAVKLMQQYALENTDVTVLKAIALTSNIGSNKALKNNGFELEEHIRDFTLLNGRHHNANQYTWSLS